VLLSYPVALGFHIISALESQGSPLVLIPKISTPSVILTIQPLLFVSKIFAE
jgi:hypothetical protein